MKIRRADDVQAKPVEMDGADGVQIRLLVHEAEGAPNFYMRQFDVEPGGHTPEHTHEWEHECYILAGQGEVLTPDGPSPVQAGDCLFVAPGDNHQFRNTGREPLKFLCLVPRQDTP
jgi:quercetin dioxygenase-like cupin family protein